MKPPKSKPPKLAPWVVTFCCVVPFFSLAWLAVASVCGSTAGTAGVVSVSILCSRIAVRLLK